MAKPTNYADEELLLALIWTMPKRLTKGQIGRILRHQVRRAEALARPL